MAIGDLALPQQEAQEQPQAQTPQEMYGENFERLPQELQAELWAIICEQEREDSLSRLNEIRAITQRRRFFRGKQYDWWNESGGNVWMNGDSPNAWVDQGENFQQPTFQHVTNIYQAYALSVMTVISQNAVPALFTPESARNPKDVATAKQATKIVQMIHRNNDMQNKADDATYFMWNDGFLGAYVRYVSDGERFGWDEQEELELQEQEISPAGVQCLQCSLAMPAITLDDMPICPQCQLPMTEFPRWTAEVPVPTGKLVRTPKGREVIDVIGALNLKRTMYANDQSQFMYFTWITDIHRAQAKALFPHVKDKLEKAGSGFSGNPSEGYEKLARYLLFTGGVTPVGANFVDLLTLRRTWLRPNSFERIKDDDRREMLKSLYPEGCFVTFCGDVYCQSKVECMDECWETMQTMPGEGQVRETMGSALVPIQEQYNDASNMIFEQGMYGTPEAFGDKDVIDFEARSQQGAMPGNMSPVKLSANQDIRSKVLFTQAVEPSVALQNMKMELFGNTAQFITGAFAALYGGDTGGNDTASGIAMQRNQALGRIGRAWRRLQVFWANTDAKAVTCFGKNRTEDVEIPKLGGGGEFQSEIIPIDEVQGKITAYPEVDQQYPVLQSEIAGQIQRALESANPVIAAVLTDPDNLEFTMNRLGYTEIQVPGEQQRKKTYLVIDQLLQQQPIQVAAQEGAMPEGEPAQPILLPSIAPDPDVDQLDIAAATAGKWLLSDAGLAAEQENPEGFENVKLYKKAAEQMAKSKQLNEAIAAQALQGGGPAADLGGANDVQPEGEGPQGAGESAPTE